MVKMTRYELGVTCLTILQFKVKRNGMELRPEAFEQKVKKVSKLIGATREDVVTFFKKFILPEVLEGCGLVSNNKFPEPTDEDARMAYRILKIEYFWDLRELGNEVTQIVNKTPLPFDDVAAVITFIATKHIRDQFGEKGAFELEISDKSE